MWVHSYKKYHSDNSNLTIGAHQNGGVSDRVALSALILSNKQSDMTQFCTILISIIIASVLFVRPYKIPYNYKLDNYIGCEFQL